jgi:Flp pilus assembly protein TadG
MMRAFMGRLKSGVRRLRDNVSGVVLIEFAYILPLVIGTMMVGAELTNYTTAKMRMSQLALHIADNGSRIGTGTLLANKQITEAQINDLLTGAGAQAGNLDIYTHGRVIVSSLQPIANPNTTSQFKIMWQRCRGTKNVTSSYGVQGATNLTGITAKGQLITAPDDGAVIFVEISYTYQPLFGVPFAKNLEFKDVAAFTVRDTRDYTTGTGHTVGIYNPEPVTVNDCSRFTTT